MIQKHCFECGTALIEKELEELMERWEYLTNLAEELGVE